MSYNINDKLEMYSYLNDVDRVIKRRRYSQNYNVYVRKNSLFNYYICYLNLISDKWNKKSISNELRSDIIKEINKRVLCLCKIHKERNENMSETQEYETSKNRENIDMALREIFPNMSDERRNIAIEEIATEKRILLGSVLKHCKLRYEKTGLADYIPDNTAVKKYAARASEKRSTSYFASFINRAKVESADNLSF